MKKIFIICCFILSSCSFFNKKTVELGVDSFPKGAEIYVNDQYYGVTPAVINLPPKDGFVTLNKRGYGTTSFKTPIFIGAVRTHADGSVDADGVRCILDMASVIFSFGAYTGKCSDFKEKQHKITIPNNYSSNSFYQSEFGYGSSKKYDSTEINGYNQGQQKSLMGVGSAPSSVINYYYDQDTMKNVRGPSYTNPYLDLKNQNKD
jgi:hypothetical protein